MYSAIRLDKVVIRFRDPFDNEVAINGGWIEVEASNGFKYRYPTEYYTKDDFVVEEDDFGEPIVWVHNRRDGLVGKSNYVDELSGSFVKWRSDDDRVLNMSVQDAIRANPNRITMSMDDMLDMLTESEEQNNGTV